MVDGKFNGKSQIASFTLHGILLIFWAKIRKDPTPNLYFIYIKREHNQLKISSVNFNQLNVAFITQLVCGMVKLSYIFFTYRKKNPPPYHCCLHNLPKCQRKVYGKKPTSKIVQRKSCQMLKVNQLKV